MIDALQACVRDGDGRALLRQYAAGARLEAFLPHETIMVHGPRQIVDVFADWWSTPAEIVQWTATDLGSGIDITVERHPGDPERPWGSRQWHEVHVAEGRITRHRIWSDRPRHRDPKPLPKQIMEFVGDAIRTPGGKGGFSGSQLESIVAADGTKYVLKHVRPDDDLLLRETHDLGREALVSATGVLERVPGIDNPVVMVAAEDGGWAILQRDVSEHLLATRDPDASGATMTEAERRTILHAVARMHDVLRGEAFPWATSVTDRLRMLGPQAMAVASVGPDALPRWVSDSWRAFFEIIPADVADAVTAIHEHPERLAAALEAEGTTLIHGDLWAPNIGLAGDRVILLDWAQASNAPPEMELAFWAIWNASFAQQPSSKLLDEAIAVTDARTEERPMQLSLLAEFAANAGARGWARNTVDHVDLSRRPVERADLDWWIGTARSVLEATWAPG